MLEGWGSLRAVCHRAALATVLLCLSTVSHGASPRINSASSCEGGGEFCDRSSWFDREVAFDNDFVTRLYDHLQETKQRWHVPLGIGAWHWYHEDLVGSNDGYGIEGLRGTYWWFVTADPTYELSRDTAIGGHLEYRLRDGDPFRSFFPDNFWSYEAYGYLRSAEHGTLKAGQIWKRFGLDWDGVFFGNAPYFDGFKLDPDYGVSWERSRSLDENLTLDTFVQFFVHEDGVNGSFGGADAESVPGFNERNTLVLRAVPNLSLGEDRSLAIGVSGFVGEIDSSRTDVASQNTTAYAVDVTYTSGRWRVFGEGLQSFGIINPARYVSGGPSNRITGFLCGTDYDFGPMTSRLIYSATIDDNPHAMQNLVVLSNTIAVTKNVDFYLEYVNHQVSGNAANPHVEFFNSLEFVIYWHF